MLLEAADAALVPRELVAVTVNVYEVLDCKPVTVTGEDAPVPVNPPGLDVTVYAVIGKPPSKVGAVNVTVAAPLLKARPVPTLVAVPIVGALGTSRDEDATVPRILIRRSSLQSRSKSLY
jgi:hypothetical protein